MSIKGKFGTDAVHNPTEKQNKGNCKSKVFIILLSILIVALLTGVFFAIFFGVKYYRVEKDNTITSIKEFSKSSSCDGKGKIDNYKFYDSIIEGFDFFRDDDKNDVIVGGQIDTLNSDEQTTNMETILIRTNSDGSLQKTRISENVAHKLGKGYILNCRDGGIVVTGITEYGSYIKIMKLDSNNQEVWSYQNQDIFASDANIIEDDDESIIVVGTKLDPSLDLVELWIAKIKAGESVWTLEYGNQNRRNLDDINARVIIKNPKENNYIIAGKELGQPFTLAVTEDGEIASYYLSYFPHNSGFTQIVEVPDGFMLFESNDFDEQNYCLQLSKMSFDNTRVMYKETCFDTCHIYHIHAAVSTPNILVLGGERCFFNEFALEKNRCGNVIMGFDFEGNLLWEDQFSGGKIKKIIYDDGELIIMEDLYNGIATYTYTRPI